MTIQTYSWRFQIFVVDMLNLSKNKTLANKRRFTVNFSQLLESRVLHVHIFSKLKFEMFVNHLVAPHTHILFSLLHLRV